MFDKLDIFSNMGLWKRAVDRGRASGNDLANDLSVKFGPIVAIDYSGFDCETIDLKSSREDLSKFYFTNRCSTLHRFGRFPDFWTILPF
jgi:hypothetical protein